MDTPGTPRGLTDGHQRILVEQDIQRIKTIAHRKGVP
jgi:hypothetical protein